MFYLPIALLFSTLILITFKVFGKLKISLMPAVVVNYMTAGVLGFLSVPDNFQFQGLFDYSWFPFSVLTGFTLIFVFLLYGTSAQKVGVALTTVTSKMSVIIPVLLGFLIIGDRMNLLKIIGIIMALLAFYFTFRKEKGYSFDRRNIVFPLLLFIGSGSNDSVMKYAEHYFIGNDLVAYLATAFSVSMIFGVIILLTLIFLGKQKLEWRGIVGGLLLGAFNWYSTIFFIHGLREMDVSLFIPVFNAALVTIAALVGFLIFREKLRPINWMGIAMAVLAISLMALS